MQRIVSVLSAIFAISAGIIVLLGYFVPVAPFPQMRSLLIDWAVVIAGVAVLVGIFNLVAVQMERIRTKQKGSSYGAVLVLSLIITFGLGLLGIISGNGPEAPVMQFTVDAIIVPVEATLMAILAVTLIYASIRLLRRRVDVMSVLFLIVALVSLLAIMPTPIGPIPLDQTIQQFVGMFSRGGARGLLIGIALGTLLTGLRVLFGADRPYGDN
jgi:hypothetical protein